MMPEFKIEISSPSPSQISTSSSDALFSPLPPSSSSETLAFRINASTRQIHHRLNAQITSRIPLSLPPYSSDPSLYLLGIETFAELFWTVENSWKALKSTHISTSKTLTITNPSDISHIQSERLTAYLSSLIPEELWRTESLQADITFLESRLQSTNSTASPSNPEIERITTHIKSITTSKPHTLLAYSWVLYMAIFSGGRWIRSQLRNAGPEFWTLENNSDETSSDEGISLFSFPTTLDDGEHVKTLFKERFKDADDLLSEAEKSDVIREAEVIFEMCLELVDVLDKQCDAKKGSTRPRLDTDLLSVSTSSANMLKSPVVLIHNNMHTFAIMMAVAFGIGSWFILSSFGSDWRGALVDPKH